MRYYIEQRKWATGLWEKRECTTGRKELKAMTPADRAVLLREKARKLPERRETVWVQPPHVPDESPYREYAYLWYATHGKELKRIARFGQRLKKN